MKIQSKPNVFTIILFFICLNSYCQQIQWAKAISAGPTCLYFDTAQKKLCFSGYSNYYNLKLNSTVYNIVNFGFFSRINKNGIISSVFKLSQGQIPNDIYTDATGIYPAGTSVGGNELVFSKQRNSGTALWYKNYSSNPPYNHNSTYYPNNTASSVTGYKNSVYLSGSYQDSIKIANQWLFGTNSQVSRYDTTTGSLIWAKSVPGFNCRKIENLNNGSFYVAGDLSNSSNYDTVPVNIVNRGSVVSKINNQGQFLWAKQLSERTSVFDMAADRNKNIYVTGRFHDSCRIGTPAFIGKNGGIFIYKSDSLGNILWSKIYHNKPGEDSYSYALSVDYTGSPVITGWFTSDTLNLQGTFLKRTGSINTFVLKYSPVGTLLYSMNIPYDSQGFYITSDDEGSAYCSGRCYNQMTLGPDVIYPSYSGEDYGYLLKINFTTNVTSLTSQSANYAAAEAFPNPTEGWLTLRYSEKPLSLNVFNFIGQEVLSLKTFTENEIKVNMQQLPKGVYFFEVGFKERRKTIKVLVH